MKLSKCVGQSLSVADKLYSALLRQLETVAKYLIKADVWSEGKCKAVDPEQIRVYFLDLCNWCKTQKTFSKRCVDTLNGELHSSESQESFPLETKITHTQDSPDSSAGIQSIQYSVNEQTETVASESQIGFLASVNVATLTSQLQTKYLPNQNFEPQINHVAENNHKGQFGFELATQKVSCNPDQDTFLIAKDIGMITSNLQTTPLVVATSSGFGKIKTEDALIILMENLNSQIPYKVPMGGIMKIAQVAPKITGAISLVSKLKETGQKLITVVVNFGSYLMSNQICGKLGKNSELKNTAENKGHIIMSRDKFDSTENFRIPVLDKVQKLRAQIMAVFANKLRQMNNCIREIGNSNKQSLFGGKLLARLVPACIFGLVLSISIIYSDMVHAQTSYQDNTLYFRTTNFNVNEDAGSIDIEIWSGSGQMSDNVLFEIALTEGSASNGSDFVTPNGKHFYGNNSVDIDDDTIIFGSVLLTEQSTIITIPIIDDSESEGNETFEIRLFNLQDYTTIIDGYALGSYSFSNGLSSISQTITIVDNDQKPTLSVDETTLSVDEEAGMTSIGLSLTIPSSSGVVVTYSTSIESSDTAQQADFTAQSSVTETFSSTATTGTIEIPITSDTNYEGNETFTVTLSGITGGVFSGDRTSIVFQVTIVDDEGPTVTIDTSTLNVSERRGTTGIEVGLSGPSNSDVVVTYSTSIESEDSAEQTDFTAQSSETLTISTSQTSGVIEIPIVDNSDDEANKTFSLMLSVTGGSFSGGTTQTVQVTIVDDEGLPTLSADSTSVSVVEGSGSVSLGLTLTESTTSSVTVTYSTEGITASNDGTDYTVQTKATYEIPQNTTAGTISIPIIDDNEYEPNDSFRVKLTQITGAAFGIGEKEIIIAVSITNDDPVTTFYVQNTSVATTEAGNAEIEIEIFNPGDAEVTFTYSTTAGTATSADFTEQNSVTGTFGSGTTYTFMIPTLFDEIDEADEQFTVTFADLSGAVFAGGRSPVVTVTIEDDDQTMLSIEDSYGYESEDLEFTVSMDLVSTRSTMVTWTASDRPSSGYSSGDRAFRGLDYAESSNSHTGIAEIPAGSRSTTITVPITDDTIDEDSEYFSVTLSSPTNGAGIADGTAQGTIYDNDDRPTITAPTTISVNEADGNVEIPVNLSNLNHEYVSFYYYLTPGSATGNGIDFVSSSQQQYIQALTSSSAISIPIVDDEFYEGPETFTVEIRNPYNAQLPQNQQAQYSGRRLDSIEIIVTIFDDEAIPKISFADMNPRVNESDDSLTIGLNLNNATSQTVSVNYSTTNISATGGSGSGNGIDYDTQTSQSLSFTAGETYSEITIPIYQDTLREGEETFALTLSDPSGAEFSDLNSTITANVTIVDDEMPTLSIVNSPLSFSERAGVAEIELMLVGPASDTVEITFYTSIESGDSAVQSDFTSLTYNTLSIESPNTTGIILIPITNDTITEGNETFTLTLSEITGASFLGGTSIVEKVTIVDDEGLPTLSVDTTSINVSEGIGSAAIGLTLTPVPTSDVTVTYSTIGGTASNDGTDYTTRTDATLTISQNTATGTINIPIEDDSVFENDETFLVTLTGVTGAAFGSGMNKISVEVTIMDNEPQPILSVPFTRVSAFESGNAIINVRLSEPSNSPVTFTYSTTTGSASDADFTEQSSTSHTFGSGTRDTIMIPITHDELDEANEQFTITLADLTGASFAGESAPTVTITIEDNDQALFSISNAYGSESDDLNFSVSLDKESTRDTSVTWVASSGNTSSSFSSNYNSATRGTDFAVALNSHTGVARIPAGETSTTITIPIEDDSLNERTEVFTVTISNPTGGAGIIDDSAVGEIYDNDSSEVPTITAPATVSVNEAGGNVSIPISLSNSTNNYVELYYSIRSGTASGSGTDYESNRSSLYIPANSTSSAIQIPIVNDDLYEGNESFSVNIYYVDNANFPIDTASQYSNRRLDNIEIMITIFDDETLPEISFANLKPEINESDSTLTIRANLSNISTQSASVSYSTSNLTATGGTGSGNGDFETQTSETLDFDPGDTYAEFTIPIYEDTLNEGIETFNVTLSNPTGAKFKNSASTIEATVFIIDDEVPTLSVDNSTLNVSERAGSTSIKFKLSGPTDRSVAVTYTTSIIAGTDTAEQGDFTAQTVQTATIAAMETTGVIEIPITNDSENEDDETFSVTLSGISGAVFEGGSNIVVKVTIKDDEGLPTLTVDSGAVNVTEGDNPSQANIGLTLSSSPDDKVTVTYSTYGITASNDGSDYTVKANETLEIASGTATGIISIPINDDNMYEGTETFRVDITGVSGAAFTENVKEISKEVTITDNEPETTFSLVSTSVSASESGNAEIAIQITNPSDTPVSFTYTTTAGTATSDDFTLQDSVEHTFGAGTTDQILIPITSDEIDETDEQFTVIFADLSGAVFNNGVAPTVTVTIQDDDQAQFSFSSTSRSRHEGYDIDFPLTINLNKASSRDTSVTWTASTESGDTATRGEDYAVEANSHTGIVEFPAGTTSKTIRIPIVDDNNYESTESFTVTLSNPTGGATILVGTSRARIYDNDSTPTLTAAAIASGREANGDIEIPINLSATTFEEVQVYYTTNSGTASGGVDFASQSFRLHTIPANSSSSNILIPVVDDELYEGAETFTVMLSSPTSAYFPRISPSSSTRVSFIEITVTILDDDPLPEISFEDLTPQIDESAGTMTIQANLSGVSNFATSVNYSTTNITATGGSGSGNGVDYETQTNETLNFPAGSTSADITIPIFQDTSTEGNETFALTLSNASGAKFADYSSSIRLIVTIVDDEIPTLSIVSSTLNVSERVGTAAIELKLSAPAMDIVEVTYSTSIESGDSAQQADFTAESSASIAIVSPATTGIIAIPITNDSNSENDETFTLTLTQITGAKFSEGTTMSAKVTIVDDEQLPTLTVNSSSVNVSEGDGSATIGLTLSAIPTNEVSVTYSTTGATASNDGTDYTVQTESTQTISGSTTGIISIPITNDEVKEDNEQFIVTLSGVSGASFGPNISKNFRICNNYG